MSVNVILFWDNRKNIRVGLLGRNNADYGWLTKNSSDFWTFRETKRNFLPRTDVFLKGPLFSKSLLYLARFDTKFMSRFKKFCFWPYGREVWEVRFKKPSLYPALLLCVAEVTADHESTSEEDFSGCSCGDKL